MIRRSTLAPALLLAGLLSTGAWWDRIPGISPAPLAEQIQACASKPSCAIELPEGIVEVDHPLWVGGLSRALGWRITGQGAGIPSSGRTRTMCGTTLRYVGPKTEALFHLQNIRHLRIADLCIDLGGLVSTDFLFSCTKPNCGDATIENVVTVGWHAEDEHSSGPRVGWTDGQMIAWEHVDLRHYQQGNMRGDPTMAFPRTGMDLALRNADHWTVYSSKLGWQGAGNGIRIRDGNLTLVETIIRSEADASGCAVRFENENDRAAFVGLTTELQGQSDGVCASFPQPSILAVAFVGGEIKVPKGRAALDWNVGGSLSILGTTLGYHGGGSGSIAVRIHPTKPLRLVDNFYRMSLLSVEIGEGVERP